MNHDQIASLLEKYWEAETNVAEENQLKQYFSSKEIHPDFAPYQSLFGAFSMEQTIQAPTNTAKIKSMPMRSWARIASIAAAFVILFGASWWILDMNKTQAMKANYVEITDTEEAIEYTRQALALVSRSYKKGINPMKTGMENVEKIDILK